MKLACATVAELRAILAELPDDAVLIPNPGGNLHVSRTRRFAEKDSIGFIEMHERPPRYVPDVPRDAQKRA